MNSLAIVLFTAVVSAQPQFPAVRLARPGSFVGVGLQQADNSFRQGINSQNSQFQDGFSNSGQFQTGFSNSGQFQTGFSNSGQFQTGFSNSGQSQSVSNSEFSSSQLNSFQDRNSQLSAQVRSSDSEFPIEGVFEPLNLPSGASLLMGQIDVSFSCGDRPYGFYADEANNCQVFHVCNPYLFDDGRVETHQYSFMCGEGRVFDQSKLTCVDQFAAIPCSESSFFYSKNEEFGRPEEKIL
ncbi:uncharacterized protein LOC143021783 [Oratosquilla oratoria]|uniref:uncharacterized protein LOC143021783 n=1 Tax=Oratosquilla oratoria TaxID=337810 RepID=UPI003F75B6F7